MGKLLERYVGIIGHIEGGVAVCILHGPDEKGGYTVPRLSLDLQDYNFTNRKIPFEEGVVFDFQVWKHRGKEFFYIKYLPPVILSKKETKDEIKRIEELFADF